MISLEGVRLDDPSKTFVIAEMSGNHGHDYAKAEALVRAAAEAGAQAIKAQTFEAEEICVDMPFPYGHDARQDAWARALGVTTMRDLMSKAGLPRSWHRPLKALAESLGLLFLSTPFSVDAAQFLVDEVQVRGLKIASGDLTFTALLQYAASTGLPLIVSTGGATMAECEEVLMGPLWPARDRLVFLHCCSVYPADLSMVNLRCIATMHAQLDVPIGFSDHTLSTHIVPILAVACGAVCLEKHLKLTEDETSIDAGHALAPLDFKAMVQYLRRQERTLGDGMKQPHPAEMHDRLWARRSPVDNKRPTEEARAGRWK